MVATAPPPITALPPAPDPNDRATFNARAYPWSAAQAVLAAELGAVAANVLGNASAAEAALNTALAAGLEDAADNAAAAAAKAEQAAGSAVSAEQSAIAAAEDAAAVAAALSSVAGGPVISINGHTGVVMLTLESLGGLPAVSPMSSGAARAERVPLVTLDIDCSAGTFFTKTITANSTFTFSNVPNDSAYAFTLALTHTSGVVTLPASVRWSGGVTPALTPNRVHLFTFLTYDGGASWRVIGNVNYAV